MFEKVIRTLSLRGRRVVRSRSMGGDDTNSTFSWGLTEEDFVENDVLSDFSYRDAPRGQAPALQWESASSSGTATPCDRSVSEGVALPPISPGEPLPTFSWRATANKLPEYMPPSRAVRVRMPSITEGSASVFQQRPVPPPPAAAPRPGHRRVYV